MNARLSGGSCKQADNSPTAQALKEKLGIPAKATLYRSIGRQWEILIPPVSEQTDRANEGERDQHSPVFGRPRRAPLMAHPHRSARLPES